MSKKPTVLLIMDGFGLNDRHEANAVYEANTPNIDKLMEKCPFVKGNASGLAVEQSLPLTYHTENVIVDNKLNYRYIVL